MVKITLQANLRKITGRKVKNLRKSGLIPANIYGKKVKSSAIEIDAKEFAKVYSEAGETGLIEMKVGTDTKPVLVHNLQKHPVDGSIVHADFLQVDLKEKVEAEVPVELTGESPAEKQALGTVVQQITEVRVEALPGDLPEKFMVDVSNLSEVDQAIYVKDLKIDSSKVEVKDDAESIVAKVEPPQKEEVVEPVAPAEGEAPVDEGETAATETPQGDETPKEEGSSGQSA